MKKVVDNMTVTFPSIDGSLFKKQRIALFEAIYTIYNCSGDTTDLEGLVNLLDYMTDVFHDEYDLDCLLLGDEDEDA